MEERRVDTAKVGSSILSGSTKMQQQRLEKTVQSARRVLKSDAWDRDDYVCVFAAALIELYAEYQKLNQNYSSVAQR